MKRLLVASGLIALMSANAWADSHETAPAERMTLPEKQVYLQVFLPINLSSDSAFKPVSLAPDVWYGATDKLTLGLTHSRHAADGFFGGPAAGLCFVGEDNGCPEVLSNTAVQLRYHLPVEALALAVDSGLVFRSYDPFQLALKLGLAGRWQKNALSVVFGANLYIGVTERDGDPMTGDGANKEVLNLPVAVMYSVNEKAAVGLQTGLGLPFSDTSDLYFVPAAIGGRYMLSPKAHVDLIFSLPFLISGIDPINGFDTRVLSLAGGYAF